MIGRWCARVRTVALSCSPWARYGDGGMNVPVRGCLSAAGSALKQDTKPDDGPGGVRSFDELPGVWRNSVANIYRFWKHDGFHNLHRIMLDDFETFGPIYREKIGFHETVNIIKPEDAAILSQVEGRHPKRLLMEAWVCYRDHRNLKLGVLLMDGEEWKSTRLILNKQVLAPKVQGNFFPLLYEVGQDFMARIQGKIEESGNNEWTADLSNELFKYALESVSSVLYGERLGLLRDRIEPEAQRFIDCVTLVSKTTTPMLYFPPRLLRRMGVRVWRDHVKAWDGIFSHVDGCIQNAFRRLKQESGGEGRYPGVLAALMLQGKLSSADITASITELMAAGVETTAITLLWTLYELARQPGLQEELRTEIAAARLASDGTITEVLKRVPLVKAAMKETQRLHPIAVTLQRYITQDAVIRNYHIPSGTLVQLGLYAMGRNPQVFQRPERYDPSRWLQQDDGHHFRSLGFGFGPRQCIGRRIAETEMLLFLVHMLEKFRIENREPMDTRSTFELVIVPDKPIMFTIRPL